MDVEYLMGSLEETALSFSNMVDVFVMAVCEHFTFLCM